MLLVKSKYKIAKRLGAAVFEKTQSQKFVLSETRSSASKKSKGGRGGSDYGRQLLEKQKVRFTYGLSEKQLSNYAAKAFEAKDPSQELNKMLETRADMFIYQAGFALTRRAARQIVSHGHVKINGTRIPTPSHVVRKGHVVTVRDGSKNSTLFATLSDVNKESGRTIPAWITSDVVALRAEMTAEPQFNQLTSGLDYATVFEFYNR